MSDALRTDPAAPANGQAEPDKDARIEQLLLAGLDHYFAGQYEQAINVWTRVVFLERGHSRARAYIDRARGALAERHRESEELLYRGIAAFNSGDTTTARELITRAVEQDGPQDVALVLLERLNRLATPAAAPQPPKAFELDRRTASAADLPIVRASSWWLRSIAVIAILAGAFAALVLSGMPMPHWIADPIGSPGEQVTTLPPEPVPIARSSERIVARAKSLDAAGRPHEALRLLESVGLADPMRAEADRLRAEMQRRLLAAARPPVTAQ
jgi:tetratricopeptide (TPR) repeat protein